MVSPFAAVRPNPCMCCMQSHQEAAQTRAEEVKKAWAKRALLAKAPAGSLVSADTPQTDPKD